MLIITEELKKLILEVVDDQYINELEQDTTNYAAVTPLGLLTRLRGNYGNIDSNDLA